MIESILVNYGVLGLWTCYLLYEKRVLLKDLTRVLNEIKFHLEKSNGLKT